MYRLKFVKIGAFGFAVSIDVVDLHIARMKRLITDRTDTLRRTPKSHAPPH
jgi:hypothetical protein